MSSRVMIQQYVKAVTQEEVDQLTKEVKSLKKNFDKAFEKLHSCDDAVNKTKCFMGVYGWNDT
jgi:hypothetical protein